MIARLLTMTPHLYRITADALARASALQQIELSVDVRVSLYRTTP
jgi:23S rRNA (guanine745-N1)-methyltransferase